MQRRQKCAAGSKPQTTKPQNERQASPDPLEKTLVLSGLKPPERAVKAAPAHQLRVCSMLHDLAVVEHEDRVGGSNCAKAMGDSDGRSPGDQNIERGVYLRLDLAVDGARRLVEQ